MLDNISSLPVIVKVKTVKKLQEFGSNDYYFRSYFIYKTTSTAKRKEIVTKIEKCNEKTKDVETKTDNV